MNIEWLWVEVRVGMVQISAPTCLKGCVGEGILKTWLLGAGHSMELDMGLVGSLHLPVLHSIPLPKGLRDWWGIDFAALPLF